MPQMVDKDIMKYEEKKTCDCHVIKNTESDYEVKVAVTAKITTADILKTASDLYCEKIVLV